MAYEVSPGVFTLDTLPFGQAQLVAAFLVKGGAKTALIDPGFPSSAETVADEIRATGSDPERLDYLFLTHTHVDHAGAAGALALISPDARVITHQRGVFYLRNGAKVSGGAKLVFDQDLAAKFGQTLDIPGHRIDPVSDGDTIDLGGRVLEVLYTPGHCGNHISLFEETNRVLFSGDTCCLHYPQLGHVLIPAGSPPIYRADYVTDELERFLGLDIDVLLTPHFGETSSTPSAFLRENIRAVRETRSRIEGMLHDGLEFPQVIEGLRRDILAASGNTAEIPKFLSHIWLRAMLKTGLIGYMADILQYANDLRPFDGAAYEAGLP